ncbi:MAG: nucleotide exchange factor GrpE [Nitrosopumilaceae archaeon]|nr:nucleotide exchange factor GrpE [Nitrosopumilaceae archaeon]
MSNEKDNEVPVQVKSQEINDKNLESKEQSIEELQELLENEKQKSNDLENKLKYALADFQNLTRKTQNEIENGINSKISQFMIDFLNVYDDFKRAKEAFAKNEGSIEGLESIVKNMDALLEKNNVYPIEALGEIFDPNLHEAISVVNDNELDDNTITKEIRKGYISQNRVIRPTLVEISKKQGENK